MQSVCDGGTLASQAEWNRESVVSAALAAEFFYFTGKKVSYNVSYDTTRYTGSVRQ